MAEAFQYLLDATLRHLQDLRNEGVPYLSINMEGFGRLLRSPAAPPNPGRGLSGSSVPQPASLGIRDSAGLTSEHGTRSAATLRGNVPDPGSAKTVFVPVPATGVVPEPMNRGSSPVGAWGEPVADRTAAMEELRRRAVVCQQCPHLVKARTQVVFGVGSVDAELMFVGEAPGADEDRMGEPFVGRAGQLLTKILGAMGYSRETVYIANILKCRPDVPEGTRGNRPPRPEEMDTCKPHLLRQIEIIRPKAIVALGNTAVQGLLNVRSTMGSVRGRWQDFRGIPVMPTFHPSYLLRSEDGPDRGFGEKRKTWTDMLLVLERLGRPITEKMRGYFLKPGGS